MTTEVCATCKGQGTYQKIVFFCEKCGTEITKYEVLVEDPKDNYLNDIKMQCPNVSCGYESSGVLELFDFEERYTICACKKKIIKDKTLEAALMNGHFPKDYWKATLDFYGDLDETFYAKNIEVISFLDSLKDNYKKALTYNIYWIYGEPYSGLSSLAVAFAKLFVEDPFNKNIYFVNMHKYIEASKDFKNKVLLEEYMRYDILVVDDIFTPERFTLTTDYVKAQLYTFFKEAISAGKLIICTSGLSLDKINHTDYKQMKHLLLANAKELKITGNIVKATQKRKDQELAQGNIK